MAVEDIANGIAELLAIAINSIVKRMGYSEIKIKQIQEMAGWTLAFIFIAGLVLITFIYS